MTHPASPVLAELVGHGLHRLVRYGDGPIGLLLHEPDAGLGADRRLTSLHVVAGAWRLVAGEEVLDGSYHEAGPDDLTYADRLTDLRVASVSVASTADAVISFGGLDLVVWSAAAQEPILLWYRPGRESVVVGAGDVWSHTVLPADDPLAEVGQLAIETADLPG